MTRRVLAVVFVSVLLLTLLPGGLAERLIPIRANYSGSCGDNLSWTLDTTTGVLTVSGTGDMYNYSREAEGMVDNRAPWFIYRTYITRVVINSGATRIGSYAFNACSELVEVDLANSIKHIGNWAFYECTSLTAITIPEGVLSIKDSSFYNCAGLVSVVLPNSLTSIGSSAFHGCSSLVEISIPQRVSDIGVLVFYGCSSMTAVNVSSDNTHYASENGLLYDKAKTKLMYCPGSKAGSVVIPDSVTTIEEAAARICTKLTSVVFGKNVESVLQNAFLGCSNLSSVSLNNKLQFIGKSAFSGTSLTSIVIPDSVHGIEELAFCGSALTSVTIGGDEVCIGSHAFAYCVNLESATFLGSPPYDELFETNTFFWAAADFCIYYTASHASEWAPHGETTWQGFPIYMIPDPQPVLLGDADGNGLVNANDALAVMRYALGLIPSVDFDASDVNGDGVVNANDALMIMRVSLGLIEL